jgi:hypothetical protein
MKLLCVASLCAFACLPSVELSDAQRHRKFVRVIATNGFKECTERISAATAIR